MATYKAVMRPALEYASSRVHTGQGKVSENFISSRSGKSQCILKLVSEF